MVGGVSTRGGGLFVLAIVMLSAIVLTIPAMAAGEMTALRDISNQTVEAGTTFTVTVIVIANQEINAPALDEDLPTGWTVTEVDSAGATFKRVSEEWLWLSSFSAGASKTVIYEVTVPSDATEGDCSITGSVSAAGVDAISVGGASTVTVIGGSAPASTPAPTETAMATPTPTATPILELTPEATPTPAPAETATATATATPTPVPTSTATPIPELTPEAVPTPEEEPGFGAALAIAGLLAVAYLTLRRKKNEN